MITEAVVNGLPQSSCSSVLGLGRYASSSRTVYLYVHMSLSPDLRPYPDHDPGWGSLRKQVEAMVRRPEHPGHVACAFFFSFR